MMEPLCPGDGIVLSRSWRCFILVMESFYPSEGTILSWRWNRFIPVILGTNLKSVFPLKSPLHSFLPFSPQNTVSPGAWWHFQLHNGLLQARGVLGDTSSPGGKTCPNPWVSPSPDPQLSPNSAAVPKPLGLLHLPGAAGRKEALLRSCRYFRKEEGLELLRHMGGDVHSIQLPDFPAQPSLGFRMQNLP